MTAKSLTAPRPSGLAPKEPPKRGLPGRPAHVVGGPGAPVAPARRVAAGPVAAGLKTRLGAENEGGMGLSPSTMRALGMVPGSEAPLGDDPLTFPCEQVGGPNGPLVAPFSCSSVTFDFLRGNVLRNPGDLEVVVIYGIQRFDRSLGTHQIALDRGGRDTPNAVARDGAIVVPDGKAFIVTDFVGFAMQGVFGLPKALRELDPSALSGNVSWALLQQNGAQALPQSALIGGLDGTFYNGTPFGRDSPAFGYPALTQTVKMPVQAVYTVHVPPYPGFPDVIGARVKGYMLSQQLLAAVQDRPVTNS